MPEGFSYTYNVKVGAAGSVSDASILRVDGKHDVGDKKTTFFDEFLVTIRSKWFRWKYNCYCNQ